jgi:glycosyltransferase involved in cell wall biosynthesis
MRKINRPAVSVVISYHNESGTLETTLKLLAQQTLPPREVILVDSSSTDKSYRMIQEWIECQCPKTGIVFRNLQKGTVMPSSSMNVGIRYAEHKLLAFMDCGLLFEPDWLEKQVNYMTEHDTDVVYGVCYFEGTTLLDRSAIAQTYGYKRCRPCVPSSLIKKEVFEKIGLFSENIRAGFDVDWLNRLREAGIERKINPSVVVKYNGINYARSLKGLFLKTIRYSAPGVNIKGYYYPYLYLISPLIFLVALINSPLTGSLLFLGYCITRGYIIPIQKSRGIQLFLQYPLSICTVPFVGYLIDVAKVIGYGKGILGISSPTDKL